MIPYAARRGKAMGSRSITTAAVTRPGRGLAFKSVLLALPNRTAITLPRDR